MIWKDEYVILLDFNNKMGFVSMIYEWYAS